MNEKQAGELIKALKSVAYWVTLLVFVQVNSCIWSNIEVFEMMSNQLSNQ